MDKVGKDSKKGKSRFQKFKNRLSFFIILIFTGFVFYMGWIQIRIPEGKYALVYTKTGGYDKNLIVPGQFIWRWENLFPGNLTLHFIDLASVPGEYQFGGYLPSGELYGKFINEPDAFKFNLQVNYRFSIKEDQFSRLIESGQYNSETLSTNNNRFIADVNRTVGQYFTDHSPLSPNSLGESEKELLLKVSDNYPQFQMESLHITSYAFPDSDLYVKTRNLYLENLKATKEIDKKTEQTNVEVETRTARKMELLRHYGEVLSEFPVLLEYYGLDKDKLDPSLFIADPPTESP